MNAVKIGQTVYVHFGTSDPYTGAAVNADSLPTVTIEKDGVAMGYAPTVTNVTTGLYRVTIVATVGNGFAAGSTYSLYAAAVVNGATGRDGIGEFAGTTQTVDDAAPVGAAMTLTGDYDAAKSAAPAGAAMALTTTERNSTADALLDRAGGVESGFTLRQVLRLLASVLLSKISGAGTGTEVFRDINNTKNRVTSTVDANGNRTAITLDAS